MLWAGIVLYNPSLDRLRENISKILPDVDGLTLYNNGIDKETEIYLSSIENEKIISIGDGTNKGIAFALNRIMEDAKAHDANWVVTFDQDSVSPRDFIQHIRIRIEEHTNEHLGIISPLIVDKRRIYPANGVIPTAVEDYYVKMCITSGSCTFVPAWEEAGKYDEYLFIDLVDNDFCKRVLANGWKILRMADVELDHEFGNIQPRSKKITDFYRFICKMIPNKNLAVNISKLAYKKNVSPLRVYYTNRNIIYLNNKLKALGGIGYDSYNAKTYFGFMLFFNLPSIIRSKEKKKIIHAIYRGIKDGKTKVRIQKAHRN